MIKKLLAYKNAALTYAALVPVMAQTLTKGPLSRRPLIQRVALSGLLGAGMAVIAIAVGQRLKTRSIDASNGPGSFI